MRLRPDTLAMTATLAMLTSLGPLSTDFYLPSLPDIARVFGTDTAGAQGTLSIWLLGFAVGQVFYGPLSDRLGRKPVLLFGLGLFFIATLACTLALSIEMLIGARFVQALGASAPIVLGRAMARDLYEGPRAGKELARMGMIMGLVPAIAPVLGAPLHTAFGWQATFVATLLFCAILALWISVALPETLRARLAEPLSIRAILDGYQLLLRNRAYRAYVGLVSLAYGGLFAFISGSSFVLINIYGLTPLQFGFSFGFGVLGFITGTIIAQRLVERLGLDGVIRLGVGCLAGGGLAMLALVGFGTPSSLPPSTLPLASLAVTVPMALYAMGVGLTMPQGQAAAMMPFPERAGAASSLLGICQMSFAALVGLVVGHLLEGSALPLPAVIATIGVSALLLFQLTRGIRARQA